MLLNLLSINPLKIKVMKKSLSIANIVIVNLALLVTLLELYNPFNRTIGFMITRPEWFFSPSPVYNIIMVGSLLGLITFNTSLIINRKNKMS
jgi:hypothetical protein